MLKMQTVQKYKAKMKKEVSLWLQMLVIYIWGNKFIS